MAPVTRLFNAVLLIVWAGSACAALGGAPEIFEAGCVTSVTPQSGYSVRNTSLPTGTVIREYVSDKGLVFAVTWQGPFKPDLRKLLGTHFDAMVEHAKRKPGAVRSRLSMENPEVVIRSRGHMRAHEGQAWLPAQLPAGFEEADIS